MTTTNRIIPVLLYDGSHCVHTVQFGRPARRLGTMTQYIETMERRNIDELIILDIDGITLRDKNYNKIKKLTSNLFCPVTWGGGIKTLDDIKILIQECGIDKVSIKSSYSLIYSAARKFGSQAIVHSADFVKNKDGYTVHNFPPLVKRLQYQNWIKVIERNGAGEILLTDIERNGTYKGYNNELISKISAVTTVPIVANGGCGNAKHMVSAIENGASAVAASSVFTLRGVTPQDCARALQEAGLPARIHDRPKRPDPARNVPQAAPEAS